MGSCMTFWLWQQKSMGCPFWRHSEKPLAANVSANLFYGGLDKEGDKKSSIGKKWAMTSSGTQGQPVIEVTAFLLLYIYPCLVCSGCWLTWTSCTLTPLWFHPSYSMLWLKENWRVWHSDLCSVTSPNDLTELSCIAPGINLMLRILQPRDCLPNLLILVLLQTRSHVSHFKNKISHALNSCMITLDHPLSYSMFQ